MRALNAVRDRLDALDLESAPDYEIRSLKREELAAMGSVTLHEVYFESLGGDGAVLFTGVGSGSKMPQPIAGALEQHFASLANWKREFVALGRALAGGSGWAVLSYSRHDGQLHNLLGVDDSQALADGVPLLALDMYEHAYQRDFGANAAAYIDAFMRNVDWASVARRFSQATAARSPTTPTGDQTVPSMTAEELLAARARGEPLQVIDARPRFHLTRSTDMMTDAVYRDPEQVYEWVNELPAETPVVVYCAYGFNVGCAVTATLRERGLDARYLSGGCPRGTLPAVPASSAPQSRTEARGEAEPELSPTWLPLIYTVPAQPSRKRATVWREIKKLGAVYLRDGACVLPDQSGTMHGLRGLASRIEEMVARHGLDNDPALVELGRIIRDADVPPSRTRRPESAGLDAFIRGLQLSVPDNHEKLILVRPLYDALYAYCQAKIQAPRPHQGTPRPRLRYSQRVATHIGEDDHT